MRSSAGPMRVLSLKLPAAMIDALDQTAAAHAAPRSTVARNLLAEGLERLGAGHS